MLSSTATASSGSAHPYRPASARASGTSLRPVLAMAGSDDARAAPARSVAVVGAGVRSVGAPSVSVSLLVSVSVVWCATLLARVLVL
jgi:hypothetical protein